MNPDRVLTLWHVQLPKNGGSGIVGIMGGRVLKADICNFLNRDVRKR